MPRNKMKQKFYCSTNKTIIMNDKKLLQIGYLHIHFATDYFQRLMTAYQNNCTVQTHLYLKMKWSRSKLLEQPRETNSMKHNGEQWIVSFQVLVQFLLLPLSINWIHLYLFMINEIFISPIGNRTSIKRFEMSSNSCYQIRKEIDH